MIKQVAIPPFLSIRCGIKRFYCGLASVVCTVKKYTNDTPYWCSPKNYYCKHCGDCWAQSIARHQESVYHTLLTASGLAFTFDYPEDDIKYHTFPNIPIFAAVLRNSASRSRAGMVAIFLILPLRKFP